MVFEKGERSCTERTTSDFFENGEDFGVFYKVKSTYEM